MKDVIARIFKDEFEAAEKEGINKARNRVAADMLKDGIPINEIIRYSRLSEDTIRSIAKSLGIAVV